MGQFRTRAGVFCYMQFHRPIADKDQMPGCIGLQLSADNENGPHG